MLRRIGGVIGHLADFTRVQQFDQFEILRDLLARRRIGEQVVAGGLRSPARPIAGARATSLEQIRFAAHDPPASRHSAILWLSPSGSAAAAPRGPRARPGRSPSSAAPGSRECDHIPGASGDHIRRAAPGRHGAREAARIPLDRRLDHVDAGRFEQLEEAAGEAQRDHVALPEAAALARGETERPGIGQRRPCPGRRAAVPPPSSSEKTGAGIDDAVAGAVLERDTPLPAGAVRRGTGIGRELPGALGRHRPWRGRRSRSLQAAKPVPSVSPISSARKPVQSRNRSPAASRSPSSRNALTSPLSPSRSTATILPSTRVTPPLAAEATQEAGIEAGVEVEGIGHFGQRLRCPRGRRASQFASAAALLSE